MRHHKPRAHPCSILLLAGCIGLLGPVAAAESDEPAGVQLVADTRVGTGPERLRSLDARHARTLRRAGITSLTALSKARPEQLAKLLKVEKNTAAGVISDARAELTRLERVYTSARARLRTERRGSQGKADSEAAAYASLIAPSNECTILVRYVCGPENQCADQGACQTATQFLELYNAGGSEAEAAENCVYALSDEVVFPWCTW